MGKKASSGHGAGPECLIAAGELESERSGMERATGGGGSSDKEAESATNEEAEPFAEDGRYPNDNNRAAAGSALPLAATIDVMAATGEDNEEDVEEGESGALNRDQHHNTLNTTRQQAQFQEVVLPAPLDWSLS